MNDIQKYFDRLSDGHKYVANKQIQKIGARVWYEEQLRVQESAKKGRRSELYATIFGTVWVLFALYGLTEGWL